MSLSTRALDKKISDHFRRMTDPVFARRGTAEALNTRYNTEDVSRIFDKLKNPDFRGLMIKADNLMQEEGIPLYVPNYKDWVEDILFDMNYTARIDNSREDEDFEERKSTSDKRRDKEQWRVVFQDVLSEYSFARLDLLWDMAWSFYVTYRKGFRQGHLKVYASIMGPVPKGLDDIPFQGILTIERKQRIRNRDIRLARAILSRDSERLRGMGLYEEEISKAFERADIVQGRRATLEIAD